jgi:alcohol dehydrogenase YqhD (iron-dependent ADH family)
MEHPEGREDERIKPAIRATRVFFERVTVGTRLRDYHISGLVPARTCLLVAVVQMRSLLRQSGRASMRWSRIVRFSLRV